MSNTYDPSFLQRLGVLSLASSLIDWVRELVQRSFEEHPISRSDLQRSRLVCLLLVVLMLTFGAVYMPTDPSSRGIMWPEVSLAFTVLLTLASSYRIPYVRQHFNEALRALSYLAAAWFIVLASINDFLPNYAVGLLFIIPGIGVGYSVTLRKVWPLAAYFAVTVGAASVACVLAGGSSIAPALFIASLICISLVTLFVAASRLDAQKQFHAIEERYHAVVEQASDGIYLLDAETLAFLDANPAFCRMTGRSLADLKKCVVTDLVSAPSDTTVNPCGHSFHGRHGHLSERMLRRADGSLIYVELHIDRIRYAERDVLSVVVHDVSSRKENEERLLKAKLKAEEISSFKSSLLANMSHEIRTPLCSILGWTTVLNDELADEHRELVQLIERSGQRLHNTLDSVLELAQLDANWKKLRPVLVDAGEVVQAVAEDVRVKAETKGLDLIVQVDDEPALLRLDVACLRRVLNHVIDNAIKFTYVGAVKLKVSKVDASIRIDVQDTGVGISEEFLPSMFEEFKQESAGLTRDHEGNGLGLAISRRLVALIGGRIDVQSRRGSGSTVSIILPAEMERPEDRRSHPVRKGLPLS